MADQIAIKIWMLKNGKTLTQIARESCLSISHICKVVSGVRKSKPVATIFIKQGCPPEYFKQKRKES